MKLAQRLPRRRDAFTLIELLVVMVLILVLAAIGLGYIVFGQDNQHSVNGAQAVTGALLNSKQRARRDGLPTGVRIVFTGGKDAAGNVLTDSNGNPLCLGSQLQLIQEPEVYNAGAWTGGDGVTTPLTFSNVDFQGGAQFPGQIDESTVQAGDYFVAGGTTTPHQIVKVLSATSLQLKSSAPIVGSSVPYNIYRAPRRMPSEDIIQMPSNMVIDNSAVPGNAQNYCKNMPMRTITDFPPVPQPPDPTPYNGTIARNLSAAEIVYAPSGAVVGQGTGADKVYLWLRDSSPKLTPVNGMPQPPGAPLILSVQIRTGLIGVYPVAPWPVGTPFSANDPYAYVQSPRSSGL